LCYFVSLFVPSVPPNSVPGLRRKGRENFKGRGNERRKEKESVERR